jgi:putative ABC transport system permease protein
VIAIVGVMLRARWPRALAICVLATFTLAVAVALPAYLARADAAMIATEVSHASAAEATISARIDVPAATTANGSPAKVGRVGADGAPTTPTTATTASGSATSASDFTAAETKLMTAPWLTTIYATDIDIDTANAAPDGSDRATIPEVVFRQGYCDHVVIVAGRCPAATREVLVDTSLAARLHVAVGDALPLYQARVTADGWVPEPAFGVVSVVGTYRVADVDDPYWGTQAYFSTAVAERGNVLPIFAQPGTVDVLPHDFERVYVDAVVRPAGLGGADLATVRDRVAAMRRPTGQVTVVTSIPALLDRIAEDRTTLREVVPGLAVPVIVVGCFALFLAIAHAAVGRRSEFAVIGLRGLAAGDRWWLGTAESIVAVLVALPLGLWAGDALARLAAVATLGGGADAIVGGDSAVGAARLGPAAGLTIGLMLLAMLAGCAGPAAMRVNDLLRRVPPRHRRWRAVPARAAIVVLAVVTVVQLRVQPGPPTGVTLVASAVVVAAVAVMLEPLVPMLAVRLGRRVTAARGRRPRAHIGPALGALAVARRPGARRLLAVEVIALGMVGLAVAVAVTAAHNRAAYVDADLGAARVLSIGSTTPGQLLRAVQVADPSGRYAMAAMTVPPADPSDPPMLAVDASRLAAVATPLPGIGLGTVANELRASGSAPVTVTGEAVRVDVTASSAARQVDLVAALLPVDGVAIVTADFGILVGGRHTYQTGIGCAGGCRLVGLTVLPQAEAPVALAVTVHGLASVTDPESSVATPVAAPLTEATRWRTVPVVSGPNPAKLSAGAAGLTLSASGASDAGGVIVVPVAGAYPVPVVEVGGAASTSRAGLDATAVAVRAAGRASALPRLRDRGALVDLDALTLAAIRPTTALPAEVWLATDTPPAVLSALSDNGLLVVSQRTATAQRAYLAAQGPALGVAFGLAGAGALLALAIGCLLLVSDVERGGRTADLRALRMQGLARAAAVRSLVVSHLGLVAAAAIIAYAAGVATWLLTSDRIPVFVASSGPGLAPSHVPFATLGAGVAAATVVLGGIALVAALSSAARVRTPDRWSP